jgi:hypothetical protein
MAFKFFTDDNFGTFASLCPCSSALRHGFIHVATLLVRHVLTLDEAGFLQALAKCAQAAGDLGSRNPIRVGEG